MAGLCFGDLAEVNIVPEHLKLNNCRICLKSDFSNCQGFLESTDD